MQLFNAIDIAMTLQLRRSYECLHLRPDDGNNTFRNMF
jgi:hypothetical protein